MRTRVRRTSTAASPAAECGQSGANSLSERLMLIPAIRKDSTTGYKNVTFNRSKNKFQAEVQDGGKRIFLGCFDTAQGAATAYAHSEYGRADAAKLLQPRPALTAAGAEAIQLAEREGLTLAISSSNNTGYKGVCYNPNQTGSKKYQLRVGAGSRKVHLGVFATAEQAALFYARREAGRDTSDLTAQAARQAGREGLTLLSNVALASPTSHHLR